VRGIPADFYVAIVANAEFARIGAVMEPVRMAVRSCSLSRNTPRNISVSRRSLMIFPRPTRIRPAALVKHAPELAFVRAMEALVSANKYLTAFGAFLFSLHFHILSCNQILSFMLAYVDVFQKQKGCSASTPGNPCCLVVKSGLNLPFCAAFRSAQA
jgi:hypothetical protein